MRILELFDAISDMRPDEQPWLDAARGVLESRSANLRTEPDAEPEFVADINALSTTAPLAAQRRLTQYLERPAQLAQIIQGSNAELANILRYVLNENFSLPSVYLDAVCMRPPLYSEVAAEKVIEQARKQVDGKIDAWNLAHYKLLSTQLPLVLKKWQRWDLLEEWFYSLGSLPTPPTQQKIAELVPLLISEFNTQDDLFCAWVALSRSNRPQLYKYARGQHDARLVAQVIHDVWSDTAPAPPPREAFHIRTVTRRSRGRLDHDLTPLIDQMMIHNDVASILAQTQAGREHLPPSVQVLNGVKICAAIGQTLPLLEAAQTSPSALQILADWVLWMHEHCTSKVREWSRDVGALALTTERYDRALRWLALSLYIRSDNCAPRDIRWQPSLSGPQPKHPLRDYARRSVLGGVILDVWPRRHL